MPYRELTEPPMSILERAILVFLSRGVQGDNPFLAREREAQIEKLCDLRIVGHSPAGEDALYHERCFFRDGFRAYHRGIALPDAGEEHLTRVGRRNLSAFQKGWCAAERGDSGVR